MTPRTMTEPEAWREIARRIVNDKQCRVNGIYTLAVMLLSSKAIYSKTHKQMERRVGAYFRISEPDYPFEPEARALAALWLALEAEEEAA